MRYEFKSANGEKTVINWSNNGTIVYSIGNRTTEFSLEECLDFTFEFCDKTSHKLVCGENGVNQLHLIILHTGGSNPPDCGSFDGIIGVGNPGGECKKCLYNQFGTGENGSKACKNRRRVYILREGEVFPLLLSLPTGSLKAFTQQISKGRKLNSVVTRFALKKATNAGGIAYSQAVFSLDRVLTPEEYALIEKMSEKIKTYSSNVGFDADSMMTPEDEISVDPETGEIIEPPGGNEK